MKPRMILQWMAAGAALAAARLALRGISLTVQQRLNPTLTRPPYAIVAETAAFHNRLMVADLHCDALLWDTNLSRRNRFGHVDVPRLLDGNVALQVFSAVTKVPPPGKESTFGRLDLITLLSLIELWPPRTWSDLTARAIYQACKLKRIEARSHSQLTIVKSRKDLADFLRRREAGRKAVAAVLAVEGAHSFRGNVANIDALYDAGFRIVGLTHLSDNEIGGANTGEAQYGLTDYGREVVKKLEERGLIIDLAHASPSLIRDVLAVTKGPALVTHTGVKGICPNQRNLGDREIKDIAERGGLIGLGFGPVFTCAPGAAAIARSIAYVARLVGVEHVALGSDYDGVIEAPFDASGLPLLTQELKNEGFVEDEIRKIMGGNAVRFLARNLPA